MYLVVGKQPSDMSNYMWDKENVKFSQLSVIGFHEEQC